ncbi:MAG: hypothetical protein EP297_15180 [Gammaproteobacteria bacterium]|nr:MAG: hypothetical protein EP297_15180 [Gammaproteobacteria bacterium]
MFFIKFHKGEPNTRVLAYRNGETLDYGPGHSLWYTTFNTSLAAVPIMSNDAHFIFNEATTDFQEISIQGQLTYRLEEPLKAARYLDFTIDPRTNGYRSDDPDVLEQRIINTVQAYTRTGVNAMSLEQALTEVRNLSTDVLSKVRQEEDLIVLGVVVENLHFTSVTATPEIRKALETDYREGLQKRADQAIYDRRYAAQEEERKLSQRELETSIELEDRRKDLVEMQAQNNLTLAEADAKAEELRLNPYGEMAPQALVGLALKEWAGNAGNIDHLNISADMLSQLVTWVGQQKQEAINE